MSNMEQAMQQLAAEMTGQDISAVPDTLEGICAFIAQNYSGGGTSATPSVDNLSGTGTTGKALMKATDADAARKVIGAGTSNFSGSYNDLKDKPAQYTLPAAGNGIGGVKRAAAVSFTAEGATAETCAAAIASIIANLKAAGSMA